MSSQGEGNGLLAREEGGYPGLQWAHATSDPRWRGEACGPNVPMAYAVPVPVWLMLMPGILDICAGVTLS
jgi:hypothetical protein